MKRNSSAENKAESITVLTHSYTKWNIPEGLSLAFTPLYRNFRIQTRAE